MKLTVNGEAWVLHFRHQNNRILTARWTHAWLHQGACVLRRNQDEITGCVLTPDGVAGVDFPTNVLRRRAAFVHGHPVAIRERWSMPFSRAVGRREALTKFLATMFPTR